MVSHPCLFVFAVFGFRSTIAGEVKCNISIDSRNAVLDCHLPCEGLITFLKWTKNNSILALWKGTNYTHTNRTGFKQPWNPSFQNISLQISNITKKDSGEYNYDVVSDCETLKGSVHLNIPDMNCTALVNSSDAFLDCHIQYEIPFVIHFLKWTKNNSTLALWNGTNYTHTNHTGFKQPWNASSQDISLQINNFTKEDGGEYIYTVVSACETLKGSVHLDIPEPSPYNGTKTSIHSQVLFVVGILTAVLVLGIIVLWKKKKKLFSYTTSKRLNLNAYFGEIHSIEVCPLR